jgi:hypothetical protein
MIKFTTRIHEEFLQCSNKKKYTTQIKVDNGLHTYFFKEDREMQIKTTVRAGDCSSDRGLSRKHNVQSSKHKVQTSVLPPKKRKQTS